MLKHVALTASVIFMATVSSATASGCTLPDFLSSRSRWESRITLERRRIGSLWTFTEHAATMTDATSRDQSTTTYTCETVSDADSNIFLTSVSIGDKADQQLLPVYQCLQFIRRSPSVVQIARSMIQSSARDVTLCESLVLDEFPLVWPRPDDAELSSCGIIGGYSFSLADADGNQLCAEAFLSPIMEADCAGSAEGIWLDFRQLNCIGLLGLSLTSRLDCLGSWTVGAFMFSIVSDRNVQWPKLWMLRFPAFSITQSRLHAPFIGHVMTSIVSTHVSDPTTISAAAGNLVYAIHATPTSFPSLCSDEASRCDADRCADDDYYGGSAELHCQKTCQVCSGNDSTCSFDTDTRGLWLESFSERGSQLIAIDATSLSVGSQDYPSICAQLTVDRWMTATNRRPVVALYPDTGCRPRLTCYEFVRQNDAVLVYRTGRRVQWPVTSSFPLTSGAVCGDDLFRPDPKIPSHLAASRQRILVRADVSPRQSAVACGFSGWFRLSGQVSAGGTSNVTAFVDTCGTEDSMSFRYVENRQIRWTTETHHCLATFTDPATTDRYVITISDGSLGHQTNVYCWLFHQNVWDPHPRVYLTLAADCNAETSVDILYRGSANYVAHFDVIPPSVPGLTPTTLSHDCTEQRPALPSTSPFSTASSSVQPMHVMTSQRPTVMQHASSVGRTPSTTTSSKGQAHSQSTMTSPTPVQMLKDGVDEGLLSVVHIVTDVSSLSSTASAGEQPTPTHQAPGKSTVPLGANTWASVESVAVGNRWLFQTNFSVVTMLVILAFYLC